MEEGGKPDGLNWSSVTQEDRTLFEILFYSQGPVDGYLLGENVRDLFLKSGLSLRVLSQIWNLADVSSNNVLNVHEFVLAMHLTRGLLKGLKLPPTLPRKLAPPTTEPVPLSPATVQEREAYVRLFKALDSNNTGYISSDVAKAVFDVSRQTPEVLARLWDLSDVNRDGRLDEDEFCLACHLLRLVAAGNTLAGPVDVFVLLPDRVAAQSLQSKKRRVQKYEEHKQKLMLLKEKRRQQVVQESQRLQLKEAKVELIVELHKLQTEAGTSSVADDVFNNSITRETEEIKKLKDIVFRLKKEHEKVRQETVKIILAEQKLSSDTAAIKKDADELNRRLSACLTHATKDPDPFHQLFEQRKEKRQGSTIKDLDKIDVYFPFAFSPFDTSASAARLSQGSRLFSAPPEGSDNRQQRSSQYQAVLNTLQGFGDDLLLSWASVSPVCSGVELEEDPVFKEETVNMADDQWLGLQWSGGGGGHKDGGVAGSVERLQEKLMALKTELQKLNQTGTRLVFRNPEDYNSDRGSEEEERGDRGRGHPRSASDRRSAGVSGSPRLRERHSYTERNDTVSQAVREYRQKRLSAQNLESADISCVASVNNLPVQAEVPTRPPRARRSLARGSAENDKPGSPQGEPVVSSTRLSQIEPKQKTSDSSDTVSVRQCPSQGCRTTPADGEKSPVATRLVAETSFTPQDSTGGVKDVSWQDQDKKTLDEVTPALLSSKKTRAPRPPSEVVVAADRAQSLQKTPRQTSYSDTQNSPQLRQFENLADISKPSVNLSDQKDATDPDVSRRAVSKTAFQSIGESTTDISCTPDVDAKTANKHELLITTKFLEAQGRQQSDSVLHSQTTCSKRQSKTTSTESPLRFPENSLGALSWAVSSTRALRGNVSGDIACDQEHPRGGGPGRTKAASGKLGFSSAAQSPNLPAETSEREALSCGELSTTGPEVGDQSCDRLCVALDNPALAQHAVCRSDASSAYDSDADSNPPPLPSSAPPPVSAARPPSPAPSLSSADDVVQEQHGPVTSGITEQQALVIPDMRLPAGAPPHSTQQMASSTPVQSCCAGLEASAAEGEVREAAMLSASSQALHVQMGSSTSSLEVHTDLPGVTPGRGSILEEERNIHHIFLPGDSDVQLTPSSSHLLDDAESKVLFVSHNTHDRWMSQERGDDYSTASAKGDDYSTASAILDSLDASLGSDSALGDSLSLQEVRRPDSLALSASSSPATPLSHSPPSSRQDADSLSPRGRDIVEKARHFADRVVVRRDPAGSDGDLDHDVLHDLELQRRAAISESTVRRRDAKNVLSPLGIESVEQLTPTQIDSDQSQKTPSPECPGSPVARWTSKATKVVIYSENVIQEPESTEAVDRESIANLSTTRRQWENIFNADSHDQTTARVKKQPPKWEVRLPYTEKPHAVGDGGAHNQSPTSAPSTMADAVTAESAIEQEIRLALEREETVRREHEELLQQLARRQQTELTSSSMDSSTDSDFHASFNEMTEADRGSEVWLRETAVRREDEKEEAMQRGSIPFYSQKHDSSSKDGENSTESIVEREIRLQRQREMELAKQRGLSSLQTEELPEASATVSELEGKRRTLGMPATVQEEESTDGGATEGVSHDSKSIIARELRELREREEEMRRLRENMGRLQVSATCAPPADKSSVQSAPSSSLPPNKQKTGQPAAQLTTRQLQSTAVNSSPAKQVGPSSDLGPSPPQQSPLAVQETPIEREIRLARERENELRRAKGLPELKPEPRRLPSLDDSNSHEVVGSMQNHSVPEPDFSIKRFASNRLQQEILTQRSREMALKEEGKIITTSEEHIQPLRYSEVTGQDRVDGTVKRNFKTPGQKNNPRSTDSVPNEASVSVAAPLPGKVAGGKKSHLSAGASFSYHEFKQTAESKIERELREMRQREEELRQQRTTASSSSS